MSSTTYNLRRYSASIEVSLVLLLVISQLCLATNTPTSSSQAQSLPPTQSGVPKSSNAAQFHPNAVASSDTVNNHAGRQGRSSNNGSSGQNNAGSNSIESSKYRSEQERKQVMEFFTTKNILKSLIKLMWGNQDEVGATSRQVLSVLTKVLDMLKGTFGQKARSASGRGLRDTVDDAASAGVSMLQGYVKAVITPENKCTQRYLCQASKEAVSANREIGYFVSQVAGYATSYLLDSQKLAPFQANYEATRRGRNMEDCANLYHECREEN
ncbi:hypothetical protein GZH46_00581 [Fragariocoptes setiger]|uniref:Secreted protein n=1 Tax=Fragariocoptes setiger TaxID=1670756 RepID=A0ABQ7SBS8_9ACAR|nr:hypothetical protein GZH46_00581 [Fragariocoptes setiger]